MMNDLGLIASGCSGYSKNGDRK